MLKVNDYKRDLIYNQLRIMIKGINQNSKNLKRSTDKELLFKKSIWIMKRGLWQKELF